MASDISESGSAGHWGPLWGAKPENWASLERQQRPTYEQAIRRVPVRDGDRVLDIGCGAGTFLRMASDRGARVFGIDASEALIRHARERLPDGDLRVGDMEALPYDDGVFDLVTGFNSFFFAADMVGALREAGRVAKPKAPVVLQVWGRPERCELGVALKRALDSVWPPSRSASSGPKLWEEGVLEGLAGQAGLHPESRFATTWAFEFPDSDQMLEDLLSPALLVAAARDLGEEVVRSAVLDALTLYRTQEGGYRLENEWCFLLARAR